MLKQIASQSLCHSVMVRTYHAIYGMGNAQYTMSTAQGDPRPERLHTLPSPTFTILPSIPVHPLLSINSDISSIAPIVKKVICHTKTGQRLVGVPWTIS
jgi:hypothetical protein